MKWLMAMMRENFLWMNEKIHRMSRAHTRKKENRKKSNKFNLSKDISFLLLLLLARDHFIMDLFSLLEEQSSIGDIDELQKFIDLGMRWNVGIFLYFFKTSDWVTDMSERINKNLCKKKMIQKYSVNRAWKVFFGLHFLFSVCVCSCTHPPTTTYLPFK